MKLAEWTMEGLEFANCNCIWGCPCQFNGAPTHGNCRAHTFVQIEKGRFNDVPLDGLRWASSPPGRGRSISGTEPSSRSSTSGRTPASGRPSRPCPRAARPSPGS